MSNSFWNRANKSIALGNMFLSKHPNRYLPGKWPTYYKKAKGCKITALDNKTYTDFSMMGIGTNVLGYANKNVDNAVKKVINTSTMSTLNCFEEVELAEQLKSIHKWADKVHFTRTGGEANAVAIRLARAASGKNNIAVCGYHGWHDWYLATNLNNKNNLNQHLLKGITTKGVSSSLKNTTFPFYYNDFHSLEKIVAKFNIGVIKMECVRNIQPKDNFLKKVRDFANKKNLVLIFDECTTGFRQTLGGIHQSYGVIPDIAIFGKALSNGYPLNAVIGKTKIMKEAKNSFISSTFWSDRIGPTAAIASIKEMKRIKSWEIVKQKGQYIKNKLSKLAIKKELDIAITGIDSLINFSFGKNDRIYKGLITDKMLSKNFLATNSIYVSISHNKAIIDEYFYELEKVFNIIKKIEDGDSIKRYVNFKLPSEGFERLN